MVAPLVPIAIGIAARLAAKKAAQEAIKKAAVTASKNATKTKKVDVMKSIKESNARFRATDKADTKLSDARLKADIDKLKKSGKYKKPSPASPKKSEPAKKSETDRVAILKANRARDLREAKYKGSLSKERKPLSDNPRLSNETKKLLEKFQTPKIEPPATKTTIGGRIGEGRPLAAAQRRMAAREELKNRPVQRRREDPELIKERQIEKAKAAKADRIKRIQDLRKPTKPVVKTKTKLTETNKRGKYDKTGEKQDLVGSKDVQTVRGKEYPDGRTQRPRLEGKTIESRTSQSPSSRGKNAKREDEKYQNKQDVRGTASDREADRRVAEGMKTYFPKSNPNKRLPRKTLEDRRVQLKKQARSKRAEQNKVELRRTEALAKLTPTQRLAVKKAVKDTREKSKSPQITQQDRLAAMKKLAAARLAATKKTR
jgi:hypothetical protein